MPLEQRALLIKQLLLNNMKRKNLSRALAIVAVVGLALGALLPALSAF
jgi:hypothetical protein